MSGKTVSILRAESLLLSPFVCCYIYGITHSATSPAASTVPAALGSLNLWYRTYYTNLSNLILNLAPWIKRQNNLTRPDLDTGKCRVFQWTWCRQSLRLPTLTPPLPKSHSHLTARTTCQSVAWEMAVLGQLSSQNIALTTQTSSKFILQKEEQC